MGVVTWSSELRSLTKQFKKMDSSGRERMMQDGSCRTLFSLSSAEEKAVKGAFNESGTAKVDTEWA